MGLDNASGGWYLFWSGIGADFSELALIAPLYVMVRKHNCHIHRCWRVGRHPVVGTDYIVCRKHHPDPPLTPLGLTHARLSVFPHHHPRTL